MKTRDDFRFVLLPWEHHGARFDARPDAITSIHLAGAERVVLLKAREERLFFKFADRLLTGWRESVFAVTTPFLRDIKHTPTFFHKAMEKKEVARYVVHEYRHNIQGHTALLWLINENGDKQTGWAREWCGGDWIAWEDELPRYFDYSIWDEKWYSSFGRGIYNFVWPALAARSFPEKERQDVPTRWLRGSREELSRLLRAYFLAFPQQAQEFNEHLNDWGEYGPTGNMRDQMWAWNAGTSGISLRSTLWENTGINDRYHCDLLSDIEPRWAELMVEHNHAIGLTWHHNGQSETFRRENWWYETPVFDLDVPLPLNYPPSQHQQLETRLELRDWLRDKAPREQIESWLGSSS